jgi:hypothetical protein
MTNVVRFPMRRSPAAWITREGPAWLVIAGDHGWLFASRDEAHRKTRWLSRNRGYPIMAVAP